MAKRPSSATYKTFNVLRSERNGKSLYQKPTELKNPLTSANSVLPPTGTTMCPKCGKTMVRRKYWAHVKECMYATN